MNKSRKHCSLSGLEQFFITLTEVLTAKRVVIKNTFLSNNDNADIALRKLLLEICNLHTILELPPKTFQGVDVKTVVLFFIKGEPTKNIWYDELNVGRGLGKTNPLNDKDLIDFIEKQSTFFESKNSWSISVEKVSHTFYDLSPTNPNKEKAPDLKRPSIIFAEINELDSKIKKAFKAGLFRVKIFAISLTSEPALCGGVTAKECSIVSRRYSAKETVWSFFVVNRDPVFCNFSNFSEVFK